MKKTIIILLSALVLIITGLFIFIKKPEYVNIIVNGEVVKKVLLDGNQLTTKLDTPIKENAVFKNWNLDGEEYLNQELNDGDNLEAVFINTYTVTYKFNNGSEDQQEIFYEDELIKKIDDPTKSGYKFLGWYLNDEKFTFDKVINEDITLEAKYEVIKKKSSTPKKVKVNTSSNKSTICNTLKSYGFSNSGVAAIMTNMSYESGFNQTSYNGCYGLIQWCGGRYTKLKKYCGSSYNSVTCQIKFMMSELKGYSSLLSSLKSSQSASTLTNKFCLNYERPANAKKTCSKRASNSTKFYNYVNNGCK